MSTSEPRPRLAGLAALVLLLLCGSSGLAAERQAETRAAAEQARARAIEAERLYEQRDFGAALLKLEEAYALFPSPRIHYNLGLVQRGLLREVEALESFERFLAEALDADPERRAEAVRQVAELEAAVALLEVSTDSAGAEIFVDGRRRGTAPLQRPLRVAPGPHQVVVQKGGVPFPFAERIDAVAGAVVRVEARLIPILEALSARTVPPAVAPVTGPKANLALDLKSSAPPAPPVYRRWWFWAAAGSVLTIAAVASLALSLDRDPARVCGSACGLGEFTVDAR